MTWCLDDPETAVTKVVHRFIEGAEVLPWAAQLLQPLCRTFGIKVSSVPLHFGIYEMSWRTSSYGSGPKSRRSLREDIANWATMIPMCVAEQSE
jgi:hypothetical protein